MRFLFISLWIATCLYTPFLLQHYTLGFHPNKLHAHFPLSLPSTPPITPEQEEEIGHIFQQPFTFLDLGSQAYVFESRDHKYVLKLFRYHRSRFPWIHQIKIWWHGKKKAGLAKKMGLTLTAYAMAYREVPTCTELLYVQTDPSPHHFGHVHLIDALGRKWKLPISQYRFALQRKADPFHTSLLAASQRGELFPLLDSFLALLEERTAKQIRNSDHNIGPNFGVFNGKVIEIDCGNYRKYVELSDPEARIQEMDRFFIPFFSWLLQNIPEAAPYFHQQLLALREKVRATEPIAKLQFGPKSALAARFAIGSTN